MLTDDPGRRVLTCNTLCASVIFLAECYALLKPIRGCPCSCIPRSFAVVLAVLHEPSDGYGHGCRVLDSLSQVAFFGGVPCTQVDRYRALHPASWPVVAAARKSWRGSTWRALSSPTPSALRSATAIHDTWDMIVDDKPTL